jgi:hypothetical protein
VHFGTSSVHQTKLRLLHDYFKMINRALHPILDPRGDPLILAAVWRELAVYRELNTSSGPVEQAIQGSPDGIGENQLCAKAINLMAANGGFPTGQYQRELGLPPTGDCCFRTRRRSPRLHSEDRSNAYFSRPITAWMRISSIHWQSR